MSHLDGVLSKLVQLKRITDGSMEAELPAAGDHGALSVKPPADFYDFSAKVAILAPLGFHFARFLSYLKDLNC